jgi:hypothetical protein
MIRLIDLLKEISQKDANILTDPYQILKKLDNEDFPVDPGYYELKDRLKAAAMLKK